jgi:hypothetical protein
MKNGENIKDYRLPRTGLPHLAFTGRLVANVATEGLKRRQWRLRLYTTEAGAWILAIGFESTWRLETPHNNLIIFESLDRAAMIETLDEYDPLDEIHIPAGDKYNDMAREVEATIDKAYTQLISELMVQVPDMDELIA